MGAVSRRLVQLLALVTVLIVATVLTLVGSETGPGSPVGAAGSPMPADTTADTGDNASEDGRDDTGRARVSSPSRTEDGKAARRVFGEVWSLVEGDPIPGARVVLLRTPAPIQALQSTEDAEWEYLRTDPLTDVIAETLSDETGAFAFENVDPRTVVVAAESDGLGRGLATPHFDGEVAVELGRLTPQRIRVLDESDDPVPGAVVHLFRTTHLSYSSFPLATFRPDDEGWLTIQSSLLDEIEVLAPGFASRRIEDLAAYDGATIVMHPETTIEGVVVDAEGQPYPNAVVLNIDAPGRLVQTDAAGRFVLAGLAATSDDLEIQVHGVDVMPVTEYVRPGVHDMHIVLHRSASLNGAVIGIDGSPAAHATVEAQLPDGTYIDGMQCDADGRFSFAVLPPTEVHIDCRVSTDHDEDAPHPRAIGGRHLEIVHPTASERIRGLRIQLDEVPVSYVYVRFVKSDGSAMTDHLIAFSREPEVPHGQSDGRSEHGYWRRLPVAPGTAVLATFECSGGLDMPRSFDHLVTTRATPTGEPDVIQIPRTAGEARLHLVTSRSDGRRLPPEADANWVVKQPFGRTSLLVPLARTIESGPEATVSVVAESFVEITAWATGCGTLKFGINDPPAGDSRVECVLPPESIVTGNLVTKSGRPVRRAHVEVIVTTADGRISESVASYDQMLDDGAFFANQLANGRGRLTVYDDLRQIIAEQTFDVPVGRQLDLGAVVVGALPVASGVVTIDGVAASGVGVHVVESGTPIAETSTDARGRFEFTVPRRDGAWLVVRHGGGSAERKVGYDLGDILATSPVRLRCGPTGGVIVPNHADAGDSPRMPEVRLPSGPRIHVDWIVRRNAWYLRGIPEGEVVVSVRGAERDRLRSRVTVVAGKSVRVEFDSDD